VIIFRLLPGLHANGVADIPESPRLDEVAARNLHWEKPKEEYVSLVKDRQKRLASAFREHMNKDQSYHASNSNRETFYDDVIKLAERVNFLSFPIL
jgi:hypothetical protein